MVKPASWVCWDSDCSASPRPQLFWVCLACVVLRRKSVLLSEQLWLPSGDCQLFVYLSRLMADRSWGKVHFRESLNQQEEQEEEGRREGRREEGRRGRERGRTSSCCQATTSWESKAFWVKVLWLAWAWQTWLWQALSLSPFSLPC